MSTGSKLVIIAMIVIAFIADFVAWPGLPNFVFGGAVLVTFILLSARYLR